MDPGAKGAVWRHVTSPTARRRRSRLHGGEEAPGSVGCWCPNAGYRGRIPHRGKVREGHQRQGVPGGSTGIAQRHSANSVESVIQVRSPVAGASATGQLTQPQGQVIGMARSIARELSRGKRDREMCGPGLHRHDMTRARWMSGFSRGHTNLSQRSGSAPAEVAEVVKHPQLPRMRAISSVRSPRSTAAWVWAH